MNKLKSLLMRRKGEINRMDYLLGFLLLMLFSIVFAAFLQFHAQIIAFLSFSTYITPLYLVTFFLLALIIPVVLIGSYYKLSLRRLRHLDMHQNWAWLIIVPGVNIILSIFLMLEPENK
ncbi:MAG: DUF805 domain-containing protein [Candidatus Magasanikbacteria bacterium]